MPGGEMSFVPEDVAEGANKEKGSLEEDSSQMERSPLDRDREVIQAIDQLRKQMIRPQENFEFTVEELLDKLAKMGMQGVTEDDIYTAVGSQNLTVGPSNFYWNGEGKLAAIDQKTEGGITRLKENLLYSEDRVPDRFGALDGSEGNRRLAQEGARTEDSESEETELPDQSEPEIEEEFSETQVPEGEPSEVEGEDLKEIGLEEAIYYFYDRLTIYGFDDRDDFVNREAPLILKDAGCKADRDIIESAFDQIRDEHNAKYLISEHPNFQEFGSTITIDQYLDFLREDGNNISRENLNEVLKEMAGNVDDYEIDYEEDTGVIRKVEEF